MEINYISSHADIKSLPNIHNEVAFIGRSNVGKSSLINILVNKKICFTSKKPGKTVTINVFADQYHKTGFIDLPGYGFAKTPAELQRKWTELIPNYLIDREQLRMIFVLIDIRIGFMQTDLDALNLMMQYNRPISIVFTKIDKLNPKELVASKEIMQGMLKDFDILDKYYYISNKHPKDGDLIDLKKKIDTLFNNK